MTPRRPADSVGSAGGGDGPPADGPGGPGDRAGSFPDAAAAGGREGHAPDAAAAGGRERRRVFALPPSEDVDRELRFHIAMRTEALMREGWPEDAARKEAERLFGDVDEVGEECRDIVVGQRRAAQRASSFEAFGRDVRYAARTLARQPAFAAVAVLTLALGIGANAAIFSLIDGVLLTPPPYPEPGRLVTIWELSQRGSELHVTTPNFRDWQRQARSFETMAVHPSYRFGGPITVLGGAEPARVWTASVSGGFFRVLGVQPALGRTFGPEEWTPAQPFVAVVSDDFWRTQLGATRDLAGIALRVDELSVPVVGVMPPGFHYPGETDVWVPTPLDDGTSRTSHNSAVTARLRPGVSVEDAQRELSAITRRLAEEHAGEINAVDARVTPLQAELTGDLRQPLVLMLGAAGLVLLIACTNLASTLLARAGGRQLEFAVRSSLGANRGRLVRQLFAESALLAILGTAAGLFLAWLLLRGVQSMSTASAVRAATVAIDGRVLGFSILLAVASAVLFGLFPVMRLREGTTADTMREGGRGSAGPARGGLWNALVVAEVALALVLLIGSGLLVRSFRQVLAIDPGFEPDGVLTAELSLPGAVYPTDTTVAAFHGRLLAELRALPGVDQAGVISHLPLGGASISGALEIEGRGEDSGYAAYRVASDGYFEAMGIPIVRGRGFTDRDVVGTPTVALLNETAARAMFPDEDAIGRRIRDLSNDSWYYGREEWLTIVGVVGDVRHGALLAEPAPEVYVSARQRGMRARDATLIVRTDALNATLAGSVRDRLRAIAPEVPVAIRTMNDRVAGSVADRRFSMLVLGGFAAVALLLAGVGIYGVVSYGVERRRREMGVRLALGAAPAGVRALVIGHAMRTVLAGLVVGTLGAVALTRLLGGMLFGVSPLDPVTFAAVIALLGAVALFASWVPARRTTKIDPMITLRTE